eukprot:2278868-Pleurochrysis_carterae.AAC.2
MSYTKLPSVEVRRAVQGLGGEITEGAFSQQSYAGGHSEHLTDTGGLRVMRRSRGILVKRSGVTIVDTSWPGRLCLVNTCKPTSLALSRGCLFRGLANQALHGTLHFACRQFLQLIF